MLIARLHQLLRMLRPNRLLHGVQLGVQLRLCRRTRQLRLPLLVLNVSGRLRLQTQLRFSLRRLGP